MLGIVLGQLVPGLSDDLGALKIDTVSLSIAIGLPWVMYPLLTRVKYDRISFAG